MKLTTESRNTSLDNHSLQIVVTRLEFKGGDTTNALWGNDVAVYGIRSGEVDFNVAGCAVFGDVVVELDFFDGVAASLDLADDLRLLFISGCTIYASSYGSAYDPNSCIYGFPGSFSGTGDDGRCDDT